MHHQHFYIQPKRQQNDEILRSAKQMQKDKVPIDYDLYDIIVAI